MGKGSFGFPGLQNASHTKSPTRSINSNIKAIKKRFGFNNSGYIAQKSKTNEKSNRREFFSKDPIDSAKRLFRSLGRGGVQSPIRDKDGVIKGWKRTMLGGDVITYRPRKSSDGSAVIDITISHSKVVKNQKIHFYKKENKK